MKLARIGDRADPDVAEREQGATEQLRGEVDQVLVGETRGHDRAGEGGSALDVGAAHALLEQPRHDLAQVASARLEHAAGVLPQPGVAGNRALADHDGQRLVLAQLAGLGARGERGVVGEHRAGAHEDRIGCRALLMHSLARLGAGDPLAGTVGGRRPTVEGGRPLDGDPGRAATGCRQPGEEELGRLVGEHTLLDLYARGPQSLGAAALDGPGVGHGIDHLRDARRDECLAARTGSAGVVARLQGHDRRQAARTVDLRERVDLGVRGAGTVVPALRDDCSLRVEHYAADLGIATDERSAGGEFERAPHGGLVTLIAWGGHPVSSSAHDELRGWSNEPVHGNAEHPVRLSSGLRCLATPLPSVPEFHQVNPPLAGRARGLSPPVRTFTDPGARTTCLRVYQRGCCASIPGAAAPPPRNPPLSITPANQARRPEGVAENRC